MLAQQWILQWRALAEFEIVPVSSSKPVRELFLQSGEAQA
jgi:hypothetical protein